MIHIKLKGGKHMELHRYDIIEAELKYSGSLQGKKRPYVIVSNEHGTKHATIITVMPLTHVIKKMYLPCHECIEAKTENGLTRYSMILAEQPQTINKSEIIAKLGNVENKKDRNKINKVCYYSFFYGEEINWKEVLETSA